MDSKTSTTAGIIALHWLFCLGHIYCESKIQTLKFLAVQIANKFCSCNALCTDSWPHSFAPALWLSCYPSGEAEEWEIDSQRARAASVAGVRCLDMDTADQASFGHTSVWITQCMWITFPCKSVLINPSWTCSFSHLPVLEKISLSLLGLFSGQRVFRRSSQAWTNMK